VFVSTNRRGRRLAAYTVLATLVSLPANAAITWDWSFSGESGTFVTNGSAPGGVAAPGTYSFISFTVNSSALGEPLGGTAGGQYVPSGQSTKTPYSFIWNGSAVTQWDQSGANSFNWWVFIYFL
jgi:hypothetical protein